MISFLFISVIKILCKHSLIIHLVITTPLYKHTLNLIGNIIDYLTHFYIWCIHYWIYFRNNSKHLQNIIAIKRLNSSVIKTY